MKKTLLLLIAVQATSIAAMEMSLAPASKTIILQLGVEAIEVSARLEDVTCSITLSNLLVGSIPTTNLPVPAISPAAWTLIEDFIKEALVLTANDRQKLLSPDIVEFPEYDFQSLYAERLAYIGKIQHLSSQNFVLLLNAVNFLEMPFLYVNLLTYCNLQTLTPADFVLLPRDIQGDLLTAKLKTTRMSKKNNVAFRGHTDRITGTRTDSENHLFSFSDDKTMRIWNPETCQQIAACAGHTSSFIDVCISGDKIVSASYDNTVRVWNKNTGEHRGTCQHLQKISALCIYGTKIFTAAGNTVFIWDRDTQELLYTCPGQIRDAKVLCANNQYVFSGAEDGLIRCWNSTTGEPGPILKGHTGPITALSFFGNHLMSASEDKSVRIWSPDLRESVILLNAPKSIVSITVAHNKVVLQTKKTIHIYNIPDVELFISGRPAVPTCQTIVCKNLMKIFVGPYFIVGATRQRESLVYIWALSNGVQKAFCEASCGMLSGWPSVSYDDAHDIIYMDCQNIVYACDLSILNHLSNLNADQAAKILSYLKAHTVYERAVHKTIKLLDNSSLMAKNPQFRDVLVSYFKQSPKYDWNEIAKLL